MASKTTRILIADDYDIVRFGLSTMLESEKDFEVCAEAIDGPDCIQKFKTFKPDICILDISMPGFDGIESTRQILSLDSKAVVLILSMHISEEYLDLVLKAGALGYIHKNCQKNELISAIRKALKSEFAFSSSISDIIKQRYASLLGVKRESNSIEIAKIDPLSSLTSREIDVLKLVGKGLTSQEISNELHISPRTVDTHRFRLMQKLQLKSKIDVVKYVIEHNIN